MTPEGRRFFDDDTMWVPWRLIAARRDGRDFGERGCCCEFADDGETLLSVCAAHHAWMAAKVAAGDSTP